HPRFGDVERRQLVDRRLRAVVLGRDLAEHGRVGAAGPNGGKLLLGDRDGLLHLFLGPEEDLLYHFRSRRSLACRARLASPGMPGASGLPARPGPRGTGGPTGGRPLCAVLPTSPPPPPPRAP